MSDKPSYTLVADLKNRIAAETDAEAKVALYEQLVPMLKAPSKKPRDMSYTERQAWREERRAKRDAGINLRTGLPWTPEERAKQQAASEKAKGRRQSPETAAKIRASAERRANAKIAMEQHLADLTAQLAALQAAAGDKGNRNKK